MQQTIRYLLPIGILYILNCQASLLNCTDGSPHLSNQCNSNTLSASHFICGSTKSCYNKTIECSNNEDCIVECNGDEACQMSKIDCPVDYDCTIRCINQYSCQYAIVHAEDASNLSIWTIPEQYENNLSYIIRNGRPYHALNLTFVYCPWEADCYIYLIGYYAGYAENVIYAQNSSNLYVYAGIVSSLYVISDILNFILFSLICF